MAGVVVNVLLDISGLEFFTEIDPKGKGYSLRACEGFKEFEGTNLFQDAFKTLLKSSKPVVVPPLFSTLLPDMVGLAYSETLDCNAGFSAELVDLVYVADIHDDPGHNMFGAIKDIVAYARENDCAMMDETMRLFGQLKRYVLDGNGDDDIELCLWALQLLGDARSAFEFKASVKMLLRLLDEIIDG